MKSGCLSIEMIISIIIAKWHFKVVMLIMLMLLNKVLPTPNHILEGELVSSSGLHIH